MKAFQTMIKSVFLPAVLVMFSGSAALAASPLMGTWTLTKADTLYPDGHRVHGLGDPPQGRMMVDASGHYMIEIYHPAATPFASGTKATGTPAEFRDAMLRNSVHYGTVTLDPASHHIVFDVKRSVFPNWEGQRQLRDYTLNGTLLSYQVPASATGDRTIAISEWKRLPE